MFQKFKHWLSPSNPEAASSQPSAPSLPASPSSSPLREDRLTRLIEALQTHDANRRKLAAQELGELGSAAADAIPHLALAAAASRKEVREAALDALPKIDRAWAAHPDLAGWAAEELVKKLDGFSDETANAAAAVIARIGKPCVPALVKSLEEFTPESHPDRLVKTLGKIGVPASAAAPAMQTLFRRSENFVVKVTVLQAFLKMKLPIEPIKATLLAGLQDSHSVVRLAAADILVAGGKDVAAEAAIPALIQTLADPLDEPRKGARKALVAIGSAAALPLVKVLESRQSVHAGELDAVLREFFKNVQPDWYRWRDDFENSLQHHFDKALEETARSQAAHESALQALQKIELDDAFWNEALPVLLDLLNDKNQRLRELAIQLLGKATGRQAQVVSALASLLDKPLNGALSAQAWQALLAATGGELPDEAMEKMPVFLKVQEDETLRSEVLKLLARKGRSAVPYLLETLSVGGNWNLRALVCLALGDMAAEAEAAAPELRRIAAADPHGRVQAAAKWAVELIGN